MTRLRRFIFKKKQYMDHMQCHVQPLWKFFSSKTLGLTYWQFDHIRWTIAIWRPMTFYVFIKLKDYFGIRHFFNDKFTLTDVLQGLQDQWAMWEVNIIRIWNLWVWYKSQGCQVVILLHGRWILLFKQRVFFFPKKFFLQNIETL